MHPVTTTSWQFIEQGGLKLTQKCTREKRLGGLVIVQGDIQTHFKHKGLNVVDLHPEGVGAMVLYVYNVGSPFEVILTEYMIKSIGIGPKDFSNGMGPWVEPNVTFYHDMS